MGKVNLSPLEKRGIRRNGACVVLSYFSKFCGPTCIQPIRKFPFSPYVIRIESIKQGIGHVRRLFERDRSIGTNYFVSDEKLFCLRGGRKSDTRKKLYYC